MREITIEDIHNYVYCELEIALSNVDGDYLVEEITNVRFFDENDTHNMTLVFKEGFILSAYLTDIFFTISSTLIGKHNRTEFFSIVAHDNHIEITFNYDYDYIKKNIEHDDYMLYVQNLNKKSFDEIKSNYIKEHPEHIGWYVVFDEGKLMKLFQTYKEAQAYVRNELNYKTYSIFCL